MNSKTYKGLPSVTVDISGVPVVGFLLPNGNWVTYVTGLSNVLSLPDSTVLRFLQSKWLERKLGKELPSCVFHLSTDTNSKPVVAITTQIFALACRYYAGKGNEVADHLVDALMAQALDIRFSSAYSPSISGHTLVQEAISKYPDIQSARKDAKAAHQNFIKWYKAAKYPGGHSHDYLTTKLAGVTAQEARALWNTLAGNDETIGLDHWQPHHLEAMQELIRIKYKLGSQSIRPKSETYRQAIDRAMS